MDIFEIRKAHCETLETLRSRFKARANNLSDCYKNLAGTYWQANHVDYVTLYEGSYEELLQLAKTIESEKAALKHIDFLIDTQSEEQNTTKCKKCGKVPSDLVYAGESYFHEVKGVGTLCEDCLDEREEQKGETK